MHDEKLSHAQYWSKRLTETTEDIAPLRKKLSNIPQTPLTYEECYRLQRLLLDYCSYSNLLAEDLAKPDPVPPTFLQKLLRRIK